VQRRWHRFYPRGLPAGGTYPDIPLWGLLARAAEARPDKLALVDGAERLTYRELWERVLSMAGWMRGQGVGPNERVLLHVPNSRAFVVAYYAALRAGATVSAASPALGADALAAQRRDVDPVLVIEPETEVLAGAGVGGALRVEACGDVAVLQYTSGTTGNAKGAMMSHTNLVANALQNARWFGWGADEVNLAVLPLCHTWGMCVCLNSTMAVGGTLVLVPRFEPEETLALVAEHRATVLYGSATMFHRLLDAPPAAIPSLRHIKAGAMLTQGDVKARWDARYPHAPLQQGYGLTEASPESHNNPPDAFRSGTVGIPMQDTDCRIVDPDDPLRVLAAQEEGEVCLRGPQITAGYWKRPEETRAAFAGGWLRTGDIGSMDDDGYLTIVDRKKDLLKFRGYSVSPNAVEECLLRHPAIREAVVVGRSDVRDGDVPVAFVVPEGEFDDEEVLGFCRARLAPYEIPREIRRITKIPRNQVGKPLRRVLRGRA
jgi:long-chain acyl-CoA synthetase